jgi:COMPASS component SWD3
MQDLQQQDQKEQRLLKQKIESLERENYALKKSLYELSTRFNALKVQPFQLSSLLDKSNHQQIQEEQPKSKQFNQTKELKGHQGAIYTVKYSPCGKLIATGHLH